MTGFCISAFLQIISNTKKMKYDIIVLGSGQVDMLLPLELLN
jgi:hypothetical protein